MSTASERIRSAREAANPQIRVMQAVRYAIENGGTKNDVRELVESALEEYDGHGQRIHGGPMYA